MGFRVSAFLTEGEGGREPQWFRVDILNVHLPFSESLQEMLPFEQPSNIACWMAAGGLPMKWLGAECSVRSAFKRV